MRKLIDCIIVAAILGCFFLAYAGFRMEAALLMCVVVILAAWRFWDRARIKDRGGNGGDDCPHHPDSIMANASVDSDSGSSAGGADD
jgi:hypothetical protein